MSKKKNLMSAALHKAQENEIEYKTLDGKVEDLKRKLKEYQDKEILDINYEKIPERISEIENEIFKLKGFIQKSIWLIGQRLEYIRDKELYKKEKYEDFTTYCNAKLAFSKRSVYNFIYIYQNYSQVQALAHGSKLNLLQPIKDENQRQKLLEWMDEENPTFREVEQRVKELKSVTTEHHEDGKDYITQEQLVKKTPKSISIDRTKIPSELEPGFINVINNMMKQSFKNIGIQPYIEIFNKLGFYTSSEQMTNPYTFDLNIKDETIKIDLSKKEKRKESKNKRDKKNVAQEKRKVFIQIIEDYLNEEIFNKEIEDSLNNIIQKIRKL